MPRVFAAILLVAVLVIGGGIIANTAYQAGLSTAVTTTTPSGTTVVTPVVVPAYGYGFGWHPFGFGFFGFFGEPVLPVPRVRAHPGDLLARRPGPSWRLGSRRLGRTGRVRARRRHGRPLAVGDPAPTTTFDDWHRRAHDPTRRADAADRWPGQARLTGSSLLSPRPRTRCVRGRLPLYDATDEDHPRRRRRTEDRHARPRLSRARRLRRADRRRRPERAGHDPPAPARPGRPRPRTARPRRARRHPRAAPRLDRSRSSC